MSSHGHCMHLIIWVFAYYMTLYGCHNGSFSYIPWVQEKKGKKSIKIIKKGIHLSKAIIINLSKMKK